MKQWTGWVVKARNVRYDVYEILRLVKPDTLWDVEQALKRKGVQNADKISYLIEKERVDFARDRIQLLELGWYDKDGNELHRDVVEDPRWELHKRHVQLLRNVFKPKGKSRVRNRSDYSPPNSAMLR